MRRRERIGDLTALEEARLRGGLSRRLQESAHRVDAVVGSAVADLRDADKASVEYAVQVASLFAEGDFLLRGGWARLMPILAAIRPELKQGRRRDPPPPPHFGELWPHQRLGHVTWREFVEAEPRLTYAEDGALLCGPGLGWSAKYEADLFRGWRRLRALIEQVMPGAAAPMVAAAVEARAEELGADAVRCDLGQKSNVNVTISTPEAAADQLAGLRRRAPVLGIPSSISIEALAAQLRRRYKGEELSRLIQLLQEDDAQS